MVVFCIALSATLAPACRCGHTTVGGDGSDEEEDPAFNALIPTYRQAAGVDRVVCPDEELLLGHDGYDGVVYTWTPATHLSDPQIPRPVFKASEPGTYDYVLTVRSSRGQEVSSGVSVSVALPPAAEMESDWPTVCAGSSLDFNAGSTSAALGQNIARYDWDFDGDGVIDANDPDPPPVLFSNPGHVVTRLKVTDTLGCTATVERERDICSSPTVGFSATGQRVAEAGGRIAVSAALNAPASGDVVVVFALSGTAARNLDFAAPTLEIHIPAGSLVGTTQLTLLDDVLNEADETIVLTLQASGGVSVGGDNTHTVTIVDDDIAPVLLIDDVGVDENAGVARFTVILSEVSGQEVSVSYTALAGTAGLGVDFGAGASTLVFQPGELVKTIDVAIVADTLDEDDEAFSVELSGAVNAALLDLHAVGSGELFGGRTPSQVRGFGLIRDDDPPPTLVVANLSVCETAGSLCGSVAPGPARFLVSLSTASGRRVSVPYATNGQSALPGSDFVAASGVLVFEPGELQKTVDVALRDDAYNEVDETFALDFGAPVNATLSASQILATIVDNDPPPLVDVDAPHASESDASLAFIVRLSSPSTQTVSVSYTTASGSAHGNTSCGAGDDFLHTSGTLTFAPGETAQPVTVTLCPDASAEAPETLFIDLVLTTPTAAQLSSGGCHFAVLLDNDTPETVVSIASGAAVEGSELTLLVTRYGNLGASASVDYQSVPGAAGALDFAALSGTLSFAPGEVVKPLVVEGLQDSAVEALESFSVVLSNVQPSAGTSRIENDRATASIIDDDGPPSLSLGDATVLESAGRACFAVYRSGSAAVAASAAFSTSDGSAVSPSDYLAASGTVRFASGGSIATLGITLVDDAIVESPSLETFAVALSTPLDTSLADASGQGTIIDDDGVPTFSVSSTSVGENAGVALLTVTLSGFHPGNTTVDFATGQLGDTAAAGLTPANGDYMATSGTLVFSSLETTKTIAVTILDDGPAPRYEASEQLTLTLTNPSGGALLSPASATITIIDDEPAPSFAVSGASALESGPATFTITLSIASEVAMSVDYATSDISALAGTDYTATSGTLSFAPLQTTRTVTAQVSDDAIDEADETLRLTLSNPAAPATLAAASAIATVLDDDAAPSISSNAPSAAENAGTLRFALSLSQASAKTVTVTYATVAGTAVAVNDYIAATGTVTFAPGVTSQNVDVSLVNDAISEPSETFTLALSAPSNATLAAASASGTVSDDEATPTLVIDDVSFAEAAGSTKAFSVTLSGQSSSTISVEYASAAGNATSPADFGAVTGTLTFNPLETQKSIAVAVVNDTLNEDAESFSVTLANATGASIADGTGVGTIVDDDPIPSLSIGNASVSEGNGASSTTASFTVSLSRASGRTVSVAYASVAATASAGSDFVGTSGTLVFAPGVTSLPVSVTVNGDDLDEDDETFGVVLSSVVAASLGVSTGTATILDDDALPQLSIDDVSLGEGNSGAVNAVFTVTLSPVSGRAVTVSYTTSAASALAGVDFTSVSGTVSFAAGTATRQISIPIIADLLDEDDETYLVKLASPMQATIDDDQGLGTIVDDDAAPSLSVADVSVTEGSAGGTSVSVTVALSALSGRAVSVDTATINQTAIAPADYTARAASTLTIAAGATSASFTIAITPDVLDEDDETFGVLLSNPVNASIADANANITILDDDASPSLSIDDVSVVEGNSGDVDASFTVTLSAVSGRAVSVDAQTSNATASAPLDYTAVGATTLAFAPGETSKTITVKVKGDLLDENDETFSVALSNVSAASLSKASGLGTITDDDTPPSIGVDDVSFSESAGGTKFFTVTLSSASGRPVTVAYATSNGTAAAPADFTSAGGTLSFAAGITTQTIPVTIADDTLDEDDEGFSVLLSAPTNASLSSATGAGTIVDNDALPALSISDVTAAEGNPSGGLTTTAFSFTVSLDAPSGRSVSVDFATSDSSATLATSDYVARSGTLSFAPGVTSQTVLITVNRDTTFEPDQTFNVTLGANTLVNATLADATGVGTITNDDASPAVQFAVTDASVPERPASASTITVDVVLAQASELSATIPFTVSRSGAQPTSPADFGIAECASSSGGLPTACSVTIAALSTRASVTITAVDDTPTTDDGEQLTLSLGSPTNASNAAQSQSSVVTIVDGTLATASFQAASSSFNEGSGTVTITVVLDNADLSRTVTVPFSVSGGSAGGAGVDYALSTTSPLSFAPGTTSRAITLALTADALNEANETVVVSLGAPSSAVLGSPAVHTLTILDDDPLPVLSINSTSVTEADTQLASGTLTITLGAASGRAVTVAYATVDGNATSPLDYTAISSTTLTFLPGETTKTLDVSAAGDLLNEGSETFSVVLSSPTNATLGGATGTVTIVDNDPLPSLSIASASAVEGDAGTTTMTFTVTLGATSGRTVGVSYATVNGTAAAPADFASVSGGSLSFAPGQLTKTITITVSPDVLDEDDETFSVVLSSPTNATLTTASATGTIIDNDASPSIVINDVSLTEGNSGSTAMAFTLTLSSASGRAVSVDYASGNATALAPSDYASVGGSLVFAAGETTKTLSVPVVGETIDENDETLNVFLSDAVNASIADALGVGTIVNDDNNARLSIASASLVEGDSGSSSMSFTVTLSQASGRTVTVAYATSNGTATAGADYTATSGTLTFNPGVTTRTFSVTLLGDVVDEDDETFALTLSQASGASITAGVATGTIVDDDASPSLSIGNVSLIEGNSGTRAATMTVALSAASGRNVTVNVATSAGTATAGSDYTALSTTLTFLPGQTSKTVDVSVLGDVLYEANETLTVSLSSAANATVSVAQGTITILDDDAMPSLGISDASITEGDSGSLNATFTITLSASSGLGVTVDYATSGTTATSGVDFVATSGSSSFAPGQTSKTVTVSVNGDLLNEDDEGYLVSLSNATNASIVDALGIGTVIDNDALPSLVISDVSTSEGHSGSTSASFTVALSAASGRAVTVDCTSADNNAMAAADYTALGTTTLTFLAGQTSKQVSVSVLGDLLDEVDETYFVNLSNPVNATVADAQGVGTIVDDDAAPSLSVASVAVSEGNSGTKALTFSVTASASSGKSMNVAYASSAITASAGSDYGSVSGALTFAPGDVSKTITVNVVGDTLYEGNETFSLALSSVVNATLANTSAVGTITDDDPAPSVRFTSGAQTISEAAGSASVGVELVFSGGTTASALALSVPFSFAGTLSAPADYSLLTSSPLTIAAGSASATISLSIVDDTTSEADETLTLTLGAPSPSAIQTASPTQHVLTLADNDASVPLSAAMTIDANGDGQIDGMRLTFAAPVNDSTFPGYVLNGVGTSQSQWLLAGYSSVVLAHGSAAPAGFLDAANDNTLYLRFSASGAPDTGVTPDLSTTTTPGLKDLAGNTVSQVLSASVVESDGAPPVLVQASTDAGTTLLAISFSEPVKSTGGAGACSGVLSVGTDLVYADVSLSDVTGVSAGSDLNGCDSDLVLNASPVAFTSNDVFVDQIRPAANELYDVAGNAARTTLRTITGVIHPYLRSVVSVTATKLRVTYSEGVVNAEALTLASHTMSVLSGGCANLVLSNPLRIADNVYELDTTSQSSSCTYKLEVSGVVHDLDENALMTDPKFGTFVGNERLKVVSARSLSLRSFMLVFSKPVSATDVVTSSFTIPTSLGSVSSVVRDSSDPSQVLVTHSVDQSVGFYTVIASTSIHVSGSSETLAPSPLDRTTFLGFGGGVLSVADGPLFSDPFADGTTFSWTFAYRGQIYVGPNDGNSAVFRFAPDGSNPVTATFSSLASTAGTYSSFGVNMTRPVATVAVPGATRYYVTPGTNLSAFVGASLLNVAVSGCANTGNNKTGSGASGAPGSSAAIIVDDTLDYVQFGSGGVASSAETCSLHMWRPDGPTGYSGVDAFQSVTVSGSEYLVYGGHIDTADSSTKYNEIQFTQDADNVLNNHYCNISGVTIGNTRDLQSIYSYGTKAYIAFASNQAARPILASLDFTSVDTTSSCAGLSDQVSNASTKDARQIPSIGGANGNSAPAISIDSMLAYNAGAGVQFFVANNGGVSATSTVPPSASAAWSNLANDATWGGVTQQIPGIGQLRPGEKGVPYMVGWNGALFVARNRSDACASGKVCAEVWRYTAAGGWTKVLDTGSSTGAMNTNNSRVSLLAVNGASLYVGFDNTVNGAELWHSKLGTTAASVSGNASFELAKNNVTGRVSTSGLGLQGATDLVQNKYIFSHATSFYSDGKYYLYLTVGCNTDFSDNGVCDRNRAIGATDFSIRLFRQVD